MRNLVAASLVLSLLTTAEARFAKPDLVNIPVPKLIDNLEKAIEKKPKDAELHYNLGRVHAMAYALKSDKAEVWKNKENEGAWFGHTPKYVPFEVKKTADMDKLKEAQEHLKKALQRYEQALKLQPSFLEASLGHAWLVEQSGNKMLAMKEYRDVIEKAWAKEGKEQFGHLGGNYITSEAAGYLIALLDKDTNKDEIKTLKERIDKLDKLPRPITPVAIPLRDGLTFKDMLDPNARVTFDADGSGLPRSWTWISKDAAWLVWDPHQKKQISSGLQLFGNVTFFLFWHNGYEPMKILDDDGDGFLTGAELSGLALWQDVNSDGISQSAEVKSLQQWGITKLACAYQPGSDPQCAAFAPSGVWFADGSVRPTYDVILQPARPE